MSLIDMLANKQDSSAFFDVNAGAVNVALDHSQPGYVYDGVGNSVFKAQDNYIILSMGFVLPMGFEIYYSSEGLNGNLFELPEIQARTKQVGNGFSPIKSNTLIPFPSYELSIGNFYNAPVGSLGFRMMFDFANDVLISMVNVPEVLNEVRFYVPIFVKVEHNLLIDPVP